MSSVRLSDEIRERVQRVARSKGWTISEVHREALDEYCRRELAAARTSRWDDIAGMAEGIDLPPDVSRRTYELFGQIVDDKYGRHTR